MRVHTHVGPCVSCGKADRVGIGSCLELLCSVACTVLEDILPPSVLSLVLADFQMDSHAALRVDAAASHTRFF